MMKSLFRRSLCSGLLALPVVAACGAQQGSTRRQAAAQPLSAQTPAERQMQAIQAQMGALEKQMAEDQRQLLSLRSQIEAMQSVAARQPSDPGVQGTPPPATALEEQQEATSAQIATLDQKKVETTSRFPLSLHGTFLLSGFTNSGSVDDPTVPTAAFGGSGNTGLSLRQTSLGLSASGPHLWQAASQADVDVDFYAPAGSTYTSSGGVVRLRTAHATLLWEHAMAYFNLDRPLLSPYHPESLLAAAVPELAWSGNLWTWNPQVGVSYHHGTENRLGFEAAVIDPADPYRTSAVNVDTSGLTAPNLSEASRTPGIESRLSLAHGSGEQTAAIGVGGYYSPHRLQFNSLGPQYHFTAWAGSLDFRLPLSHNATFTGTAYRGAGLGGLGGGGYRDYVYRVTGQQVQVIALDDVGGWLGLHQALGQQFTWNVGAGVDNPFAAQLRAFPGVLAGDSYSNIARNRTVFGNLIYSPRPYVLFSAEYRNLHTAPVVGRLWTSHVVGFGAAYRF